MNVRRIVAIVVSAMLGIGIGSVQAEQAGPKRIDAALQTQPKLVIRPEALFPLTRPTRIGMFTLVQPETNGEVVRVSIPVGELVSKAARSISDANHHRAARKADERVRKDFERFLAAAAMPSEGTNAPRSRWD